MKAYSRAANPPCWIGEYSKTFSIVSVPTVLKLYVKDPGAFLSMNTRAVVAPLFCINLGSIKCWLCNTEVWACPYLGVALLGCVWPVTLPPWWGAWKWEKCCWRAGAAFCHPRLSTLLQSSSSWSPFWHPHLASSSSLSSAGADPWSSFCDAESSS